MKILAKYFSDALHNPVRRFWWSTETAWLLLAYWAAFYLHPLPLREATYGLNALTASFILARTLRKRNRGQFHMGYVTGENLAVAGIAWWNYRSGLLPQYAYGLTAGIVCLYMICRGIVHGLGVRTSYIMR